MKPQCSLNAELRDRAAFHLPVLTSRADRVYPTAMASGRRGELKGSRDRDTRRRKEEGNEKGRGRMKWPAYDELSRRKSKGKGEGGDLERNEKQESRREGKKNAGEKRTAVEHDHTKQQWFTSLGFRVLRHRKRYERCAGGGEENTGGKRMGGTYYTAQEGKRGLG